MVERNIDVLCVREMWLNTNTPDVFVRITGYNIFRYDGGRGGGVCIYVKDVLTTNVINLDIAKQEGVEDSTVSEITIHYYRMCLQTS